MERLTDGLNLSGSASPPDPDRGRDQPRGPRHAPPGSRGGGGLKVALALLACAGCIGLLSLRVASLADEPEGVGPVSGTGTASTATGQATNPADGPPPTGAAPTRPPPAAAQASAGADPTASPDQPRPVDPGPYPGRPERSTPTHITPLPGG